MNRDYQGKGGIKREAEGKGKREILTVSTKTRRGKKGDY